jgi:hypothetical protein
MSDGRKFLLLGADRQRPTLVCLRMRPLLVGGDQTDGGPHGRAQRERPTVVPRVGAAALALHSGARSIRRGQIRRVQIRRGQLVADPFGRGLNSSLVQIRRGSNSSRTH